MAEPVTERKNVEAEEVPASDVRDRLTEMMNRAAFGDDRFVLTVHGKANGALIGMKDFDRLRNLDAATAASAA